MPTLASGLRISSQLGPVETIPQTHRGPHGLSMTRSVKRAIVGMSGDPFNIRLMFVYRRARRVRWRLPPPPPRRVGARTPGSLRDSPPFSRCMWGDFGGRGRSAGETRDDRGEVAAGLQEIAREPGFVVREAVRETAEERLGGRGGDLRRGLAADDALCGGEDTGAAGSGHAVPHARSAGSSAHADDERAPGHLAEFGVIAPRGPAHLGRLSAQRSRLATAWSRHSAPPSSQGPRRRRRGWRRTTTVR